MRRSASIGAVVIGCQLLLLAGCGKPAVRAAPSPVPTGSTAASLPEPPCGDPTLTGNVVTFPNAAGAKLSGYVLGTGRTALVLAPQAGSSSCSWLPYARQLAGRGYLVVAFDFTGEGHSSRVDGAAPSADVAAATAFARSRSVSKVALIGASRGGTAVLVAAGSITPPVDAVLNLSGPSSYAGEDAAVVVPLLKMPILYLAAKGDAEFAPDAQQLYAATPATGGRKLIVVPGELHGQAFVQIAAEGATQALAAVDAFLAAHAPAG